MNVYLSDAEATAALAGQLNAVLPPDTAGWIILLEGELGALAGQDRAGEGVGHRGAVPSPTYTLVEPYELPGRIVYHIDLYRIADEEELRYLGWGEIDDGLRLVEWPDRAPELLGAADLRLVLQYANSGRDAEFSALSPWRGLAGRIERRRRYSTARLTKPHISIILHIKMLDFGQSAVYSPDIISGYTPDFCDALPTPEPDCPFDAADVSGAGRYDRGKHPYLGRRRQDTGRPGP